jgi:hypothetical protein
MHAVFHEMAEGMHGWLCEGDSESYPLCVCVCVCVCVYICYYKII